MEPLFIHSIGHFHPENVLDNRFFTDLDIGTNDEWIVERVGIRERRTVLPLDYIRRTRNADVRAGQEAALYSNADTGRRASLAAFARANMSASDIGMVVAGGCCADAAIPADACRIAEAIGIDAPALDVSSACSSFGAQLALLGSMRDLPPFVLVVNAENTTRVVDYRDRASAVLWGDGTTAAIVSTREPSRVRVVEATLASRPAGASLVTIPRFGHFGQDGGAVQRFAIRTTLECVAQMMPAARERLARAAGKLRFIGHQANLLMLEAVSRRSGLLPDEHWFNVMHRGNTGAAGAPSVLSEHWDELADGDVVMLVVVGSGLTWSSLQIEVHGAS